MLLFEWDPIKAKRNLETHGTFIWVHPPEAYFSGRLQADPNSYGAAAPLDAEIGDQDVQFRLEGTESGEWKDAGAMQSEVCWPKTILVYV